jgi:hypothetical protein
VVPPAHADIGSVEAHAPIPCVARSGWAPRALNLDEAHP